MPGRIARAIFQQLDNKPERKIKGTVWGHRVAQGGAESQPWPALSRLRVCIRLLTSSLSNQLADDEAHLCTSRFPGRSV